MGRDPQGYSIWGGILQLSEGVFFITVRANALDLPEPSSFIETAKAPTREEAREKQFEMIRELSARLAAQGHKIVDVEADF